MKNTLPWLVTKGCYDPGKHSITCTAVAASPGGRALLSAMCAINTGRPADAGACEDAAMALGRMLLAQNGIRQARMTPGSCWARNTDRASGLDADIVPCAPSGHEKEALGNIMSAAGSVLDDGQDDGLEQVLAMAREAIRLSAATPCGHGIHDADTVLKDIMDEADFEENGLGIEIIRAWMDSRDKGSVEKLFLSLTGMPFRDYLARCLENTAR